MMHITFLLAMQLAPDSHAFPLHEIATIGNMPMHPP